MESTPTVTWRVYLRSLKKSGCFLCSQALTALHALDQAYENWSLILHTSIRTLVHNEYVVHSFKKESINTIYAFTIKYLCRQFSIIIKIIIQSESFWSLFSSLNIIYRKYRSDQSWKKFFLSICHREYRGLPFRNCPDVFVKFIAEFDYQTHKYQNICLQNYNIIHYAY